MDEEDEMKNLTMKEKKIKSKSKKGKKGEEAPMGTRESHNICAVDETEHPVASGKHRIAEMKKDLKKNKAKKSKKAESVIKKGSEEGELTAAYGEDRIGVPLDNVEIKMKRREMNETSHAKEAEENERKSGEDVSKEKNTRDACKKKKKHKVKRKLEDVNFETDRELDGKEANRERKKRKKEKKKGKDDSSSPNKSNKTVRFSGKDEVFSIPGNSSIKMENVGEDGLLRGRRFTPEEDEDIKAAVSHYIEKNDLGEEGLDMVLNCKKSPKVRGCWREIGKAIPYRPCKAIYGRAQNLFRRSEQRKWTEEEYDLLRSYQKEHGNKWKALAEELGKHFIHVSDAWRRIKLNNTNKGRWSQDEYQKLFDLVNLDLQAKVKVSEEKKSKHGMLRDNICWKEISDVLSTRNHKNCCRKWYKQLTSRMVEKGVWADTDDYRLIDSLYRLDASCVEDVDWDVLLDNREGNLCKKRWNQMVMHIGHHGKKSFSEQVEVLAQRYCPVLLEVRESWDSKPRVG